MHTFWWWWWSEALFAGFFFPRFLKYNIAIYSQSESVGKRCVGREQREVCVRVCGGEYGACGGKPLHTSIC